MAENPEQTQSKEQSDVTDLEPASATHQNEEREKAREQPFSAPAAASSGSTQKSRSTRSNHQGIGSGVTAGILTFTVLMVPKLIMVRVCVKLLLHVR
jgi:hypothetical protein